MAALQQERLHQKTCHAACRTREFRRALPVVLLALIAADAFICPASAGDAPVAAAPQLFPAGYSLKLDNQLTKSPVKVAAVEGGEARNFRAADSYLAMAEKRGIDMPTAGASSKYSLDDLVTLAVQSHPSVASKLSDKAAFEADLATARWQYFPTPSIGTRRDNENRTSVIMALQQPLWAGGRIEAGVDAATARVGAAELGVLETRHNLALTVSIAYQSWLQATRRAEAYTLSVRFYEDQVRSIRRRVEGGISTEADKELVVSRLAQANADLAAAESASRISLSKLSQLAGKWLVSADIAKASTDALAVGDLPKTASLLIEYVASHYPTLRRIDSDIEAAQHDVRVKRSSMWPTLNLRAERERSDALAANFGSSTNNRVMVTLDIAPGAGLSSLSAADAAQAKVMSLRDTRDSAYREMVDRVSAEFEDFQSTSKRRGELIRTRKAAIGVLGSYSRQFDAGKRGWLDVMNAARELTQIDVSLADIDALIVSSAYRLRIYTGQTGWYEGTGNPV